MARRGRHTWLAAAVAVFVVQNHCGVPGVQHDQLAVHFLERGQHERALREARRAAREAPDDPQPHVIAALAHAGRGALDAAIESLQRALRADPDDPRLYGTLRALCAEVGREDLALTALEGLADELSEHWLLRLHLGWAHRAVGHNDVALQMLEAAVASADSAAPVAERVLAHHELARIYLDDERYPEATAVLDSALRLAPEDPRLLVSGGECRLRRGELQTAVDYFERALEHTEDKQLTATRIAQVYYDQGRSDLAIVYYERAIQQQRPSPLLLNNLAWTYAEAGVELERAHELSLRAVKSDADNVVYLDTYAEILFRQGRTAQAIALMRQCLQLEPADGEHFEYLRGQMARFAAVPDSLL